jgi:integrase/recombinase XerD
VCAPAAPSNAASTPRDDRFHVEFTDRVLPSAQAYKQYVDRQLSPAGLARRTESGPLFVTSSGRRLSQAYVYRLVRRLARAARLPGADQISPRSLRHAAATAALDDGATLRDVQDFLGHADPRTTRRYDRARGSLDHSPAHRLAVQYTE